MMIAFTSALALFFACTYGPVCGMILQQQKICRRKIAVTNTNKKGLIKMITVKKICRKKNIGQLFTTF